MGVLYGRLPDFHLSPMGQEMAKLATTALQDRDVVLVRSSPLERALETAEPLSAVFGVTLDSHPDLIEAQNVFEGQCVSMDNVLGDQWRHLTNPLRPSWGEPYKDVARRMRRAIAWRARRGPRP